MVGGKRGKTLISRGAVWGDRMAEEGIRLEASGGVRFHQATRESGLPGQPGWPGRAGVLGGLGNWFGESRSLGKWGKAWQPPKPPGMPTHLPSVCQDLEAHRVVWERETSSSPGGI